MEHHHKGRPPVRPQRHFDEEMDTVGEMHNSFAPIASGPLTPLPWQDFFQRKEIINDEIPLYIQGTEGTVFLCLHGAGHSALSFACLAKEFQDVPVIIAAFDFRSHGENVQQDAQNMEESVLINDTLTVLRYLVNQHQESNFIIMGHSMGGAIAAKAAWQAQEEGIHLRGLIVIDVVEQTAMEALPAMENIVRQRPNSFPSVEDAIRWSLQTKYIRNAISARVSIPSQLREENGVYFWKCDLLGTMQYWRGWFNQLTEKFLGVHCIKQLIVAGSDRLDREMMIAQMQGKFKHSVFNGVGHVVQEDAPQKLKENLMEFLRHFHIQSV